MLARILALLACLTPASAACAEPPTCTHVIGFSQSSEWYETLGIFEDGVDDDRWQLRWIIGGGVDLWQDPNYAGWSEPLVSPCAEGSAAPDRVLLTISGPYYS